MDELRIHPPPASGTEDLERLLTAAREAPSLLDRMDAHAPGGMTFGGEGRVRKALREAVRRYSYETRPCTACDGGRTYAPVSHPMERPRTIGCPRCSGSGEVRVYSYGRARRK